MSPELCAELDAMPLGQQSQTELQYLLHTIHGSQCKSLLEIGCCEGRTSAMFARVLGQDGKLCLMDIQEHRELPSNREKAAQFGCDVQFWQGDSKAPEAIEWAELHGPFDVVFIDGSHQYDNVKADYENYKVMANRLIAFHDINHPDFGVKRLWQEINASEYGYFSTQYTVTGHFMGIGILAKVHVLILPQRTDIEYANYQ